MSARRQTVPARWATAVLVCGKCSRKLGGGFGSKGRTPLAKALRKGAGGKGRKADYGVVETGCLKLCPKDAIAVVDTRRPAEWLLVRPYEPLATVCARLGLAQPGRPGDGSDPG